MIFAVRFQWFARNPGRPGLDFCAAPAGNTDLARTRPAKCLQLGDSAGATSSPVLTERFGCSVMPDVLFSPIREFYPGAAAQDAAAH